MSSDDYTDSTESDSQYDSATDPDKDILREDDVDVPDGM